MSRPTLISDLYLQERAKAGQNGTGRFAPTYAVVKYYKHDDLVNAHYAIATLASDTPSLTTAPFITKLKAYIADLAAQVSDTTGVYVDSVYFCGPASANPALVSEAAITGAFTALLSTYTTAQLVFLTEFAGVGNLTFHGSGLNDCSIKVSTGVLPANDAKLKYELSVTTAAATDKFKWRKYSAGAWGALSAEVSMITDTYIALGSENVEVKWTLATGHTLGDKFYFNAGGRIYVEAGAGSNYAYANTEADGTVVEV